MELPAYPKTTDLAKAIGEDYHVAKKAWKLKGEKFNSIKILRQIADKYLVHRPDLSTPQELVTIVRRIWKSHQKKKP